jgi:outer membrane protein
MHRTFASTLISISIAPIFIANAASATSVTLQQAMELAAQKAHGTRAVAATARETEYRAKQTLQSAGPRVDFESTIAGISTSVNSVAGKTIAGQTMPDSIQNVAVVISQPIVALAPLFLKFKSELLIAESTKYEASQSQRNARFSGGEAFLKARKAEELLRISESSFALAKKQRADGEGLSKVGKIKNADLLRLDLAVSEATSQRAQAAALRDASLFSLAETLEIEDWRNLVLQKTPLQTVSKTFSNTPETQVENTALGQAENRRAEIITMQTKITSARLMQTAQRFDYVPTINAFARWEHDFAKKGIDTPPFHAHNPLTGAVAASIPSQHYAKSDINSNLSYGLSLKWNLWDWGARRSRDLESTERITALQETLEQTRQSIRVETMMAERDLQSVDEQLEAAQQSQKFAEELYRQTHARFVLGMATVTDLISAERDQTRARATLSNAESETELARLRLKKVTGDDNF